MTGPVAIPPGSELGWYTQTVPVLGGGGGGEGKRWASVQEQGYVNTHPPRKEMKGETLTQGDNLITRPTATRVKASCQMVKVDVRTTLHLCGVPYVD